MKHRTGLDRSQTLLFPERLEDYIAAENPVRFLDAFAASLDLHALGFTKARSPTTSRRWVAERGLQSPSAAHRTNAFDFRRQPDQFFYPRITRIIAN